MHRTDTTDFFNVVDVFDANSGTWSTAALSVARCQLAAASLPIAGLAFFAGGTSALFALLLRIAGGGGGVLNVKVVFVNLFC